MYPALRCLASVWANFGITAVAMQAHQRFRVIPTTRPTGLTTNRVVLSMAFISSEIL